MVIKNFLKDNFFIILVIAISGLIIWPALLPGYFSHQDDMQVMRIYEMRRCFTDWQLPCRWVPDLGYGNGFPLFNYYNVFPYYIGALLSLIFGYIGAAKMLFLIPLVLGGVSFYLLINKIYGKVPGFTAAILFMFAPYRALDLYVRGAVAESFAIAIIPLVFYFSLSLIKTRTLVNFLGTILSLAAFLTSHNIMVIFFTPILLLWLLFWLKNEKFRNLYLVVLALIFGAGLALFYIGPAFLEGSLVQTNNLTRFNFDFRANFVSIRQLFLDRSWGYGIAGRLGDYISFQVGWPHWWITGLLLAVSSLIVLPINRLQAIKRNYLPSLNLAVLFIACFVGSLFMTHIKSSFIWEKISILSFVQFPWRFLAVSIFSASFLGGLLVFIFPKRWQPWMALVITLAVVLLNRGYFQPGYFYPLLKDQEKLSGKYWDEQSRAAIMDYLPKTAIEAKEPAPKEPLITSGMAKVTGIKINSNYWRFDLKVEQPSVVEVPVYDFPDWIVLANGKIIPHGNDNHIGRIEFFIPSGEYTIEGIFNDTLIRRAANLISAVSFIFLVVFTIYGKRKNILI